MKKLIFTLCAIFALCVSGCSYDDSDLWNSVNDLDKRVKTLEEMCKEMNTNITSLQTLVYALQENDYVTSVTPVTEGGITIGYTINFTKSPSITIYHGKDGQNGINGTDGKDGQDGKDGYTPSISIKQDTDGHYYWTLDGEWLLDNNGHKVLAEGLPGKDGQDGVNGADGKDGQDGKDGADGKDGITPQFKIENGDWYISLDNGVTWQYLGRATGADGKDGVNGTDGKDGANGSDGKDGVDGKDGDSVFSGIDTSDPDFVVFTLADGTQIKLPTWYAFEGLKRRCDEMNSNIESLRAIVQAMESNDYIVSVTPIEKDGVNIGYTIKFAKSGSINLYNGKDGKDGQNGTNGSNGQDGINGTDGKDGVDGHTPVIGVRADNNGVLYWTVDGEWLKDENGNKVPVTGAPGKDGADGKDGQNGQNGADGKDGITPQFKIEEGGWYVSTDNGKTWQYLGVAKGENGSDGKDGQNGTDGKDGQDGKDGKDGDSLFSNVDTSNDDYVIFTLSNGTQIKLPTWYAFEQLQKLCNEINTNIKSLQAIVNAMQLGDYIVSCTPLVEDGKQIGYTITFSKSGSIVIYHGKDGKDGQNGSDGQDGTNGSDGKDGQNGKDGHTPVIGAKTDVDGVRYWTIDGEWLKDEKGNKIPVTGASGSNGSNGTDGKDGITPQLKIEDGYWYISYNNGSSWTKLGKATGENGKDGQNGSNGADGKDGVDGKDGDSIFSEISQDDNYVYLTLAASEETISIPKNKPFAITFSSDEFTVQPGKTYTLKYTITGGDAKTNIQLYEKNGLKAEINKTGATSGTIEVTTPSSMAPKSVHELIVLVNNGYDRTLMQTLTFVKGVARVTNYSIVANNDEKRASVTLTTNLNSYTVEIPEDAKSWLSLAPAGETGACWDSIGTEIRC